MTHKLPISVAQLSTRVVACFGFLALKITVEVTNSRILKLLTQLCYLNFRIVMSLRKIHARQIFDSRGNPTVEVDIITQKGKYLGITQINRIAPLPFLFTKNSVLCSCEPETQTYLL